MPLALSLALTGAVSAQTPPPAAAPVYDLSPEGNARFLADYAARKDVTRLPDGLMYRVLQAGKGTSPISKDDVVTVYYEGMLINGRLFDRTKPDTPAVFATGNLIPGWTEALFKMKAGDTWELVIPSALAYGADGAGKAVPPDQTLVFIVKLAKVEYAP